MRKFTNKLTTKLKTLLKRGEISMTLTFCKKINLKNFGKP